MRDFMLFRVLTQGKDNKAHDFIVKSATAIDALQFVRDTQKTPVLGVYPTDYYMYLDATQEFVPDEAKDEKEQPKDVVSTDSKEES